MIALLMLPVLAPTARADDASLARNALSWIASQSALASLGPYAVEPAAALGIDAATWPSPRASVLAATARYPSFYGQIYAAERAAHAYGVDGYDPREAGGVDLVARIRAGFDGTQFGNVDTINDDVWAILALRAAGVPASDAQIQAAADAIVVHRAPDGGWAYTSVSTSSDTDITGMTLAALADAGRGTGSDVAAERFLSRSAAPGGGHGEAAGGTPQCQSTVWAIHAETLLGLPTDSDLAFLRSLVNRDGGLGTQPGAASNFMCTSEAALALAGGRYPMPGLATGELRAPATVGRGDALAFSVEGDMGRVAWRTPWGAFEGAAQSVRPAVAGNFDISVEAHGAGTVFRRHASVRVEPIHPRILLDDAPIHAWRGQLVTLAPNAWTDEGRIGRILVDWGEGNATTILGHAYATPGARIVRVWVVDDLGTRSDDALVEVNVTNRPPVWGALLANLTVDRLWKPPAHWNVSDPDGDPVAVALDWDGNLSLGEHALHLVARDGWGGESTTITTLVVVNDAPILGSVRLPERAQEGDVFSYAVSTSDPDGPAPRVVWRFGDLESRGASGTRSLPAGNYTVVVEATDADGATSRAAASLVVDAAPAQPKHDITASARRSPDAPPISETPTAASPSTTPDPIGPAALHPAPDALAPIRSPTPNDISLTPAPAPSPRATPAPSGALALLPAAVAALLLARRRRGG